MASNRGIVRLAFDWGGYALIWVGAGIAAWSSFWIGLCVSLLGLVLMACGVCRITREPRV